MMTINTKKPETPAEREHENMRRELWIKMATAAAHECSNYSSPATTVVSIADGVLKAFDSRFEEPI